MSNKKVKKNNLLSNKQGQLHMPVHMQLCDDREFLTKMLGKQSGLEEILSNNSELSGLDSQLGCSGLISSQTTRWIRTRQLFGLTGSLT